MSIRVLAVGKKHEAWVAGGIDRFSERLRPPFTVEWELVPHSAQSGLVARQEESGRLLKRLNHDQFVILLDETGQNIDSPALVELLQPARAKSVTLIIGGAYGVDQTLQARADFIWSLSRLVFPHQLVRLMLAEQIYRAQEIARGSAYHHQ